MNKAFKWNAKLSAAVAAGFDAALRFNDPIGVICGHTVSLPIASGQVLKAGTLLTKSGPSLVKLPSCAESTSFVFDADITGTSAKKVVWTVAGLTITSATNILYLADLFLLLSGAEAGTTGAALLATYTAAGGSGFTSVAGTLTGYHVLGDLTNKKLLFVSSSFQTNVSDLTSTLVDTASSPVDLSSHVTTATVAFSSSIVHGVLAMDIDTTSGAASAAVFEDGKFYDNYFTLAQEPEVDVVGSAKASLYASGIYTIQQLNLVLTGTEFDVIEAGTATV